MTISPEVSNWRGWPEQPIAPGGADRSYLLSDSPTVPGIEPQAATAFSAALEKRGLGPDGSPLVPKEIELPTLVEAGYLGVRSLGHLLAERAESIVANTQPVARRRRAAA